MGIYSVEKNVQILVAVLKANNIKKVVVSPGTTNVSFVVSLVNDGSFEMYSAVDERGAAYIACGLSSESGEPVVITCTGATASRNYFPGLTEAYHRKLPILVVTASQDFSRAGNLSAQYIDRTVHPIDSVVMSVQIPIIRCDSDEFVCTLRINQAVLEMFRRGGGPTHINLASTYQNDFSVTNLSHVRILKRFLYGQPLPAIPKHKKIAIIVGAHKQWSELLTKVVDDFCALYDSVVLVDHSSHYWGKYRVLPTIITSQEQHRSSLFDIDLLIHIGEEQGDYYTDPPLHSAKEVWRISEDGEIRDTYGKLTNTFEMSEEQFFHFYTKNSIISKPMHSYFDVFQKELDVLYGLLPEFPFSNIWIAQQMIPRFPQNACLELGVSNTMRSWTFFDFCKEIYVLANTGCRGIDGAIPTLLGMSLATPEKVHYAVMGDLTFFYSFNVLGNRHVGKNIRILLINNGCGLEFNMYPHRAYRIYDGDIDAVNEFIAAGGHNGRKSKDLVKHYVEDLGFDYFSASCKNEFISQVDLFLSEDISIRPMLFEVFTDVREENEALRLIRHLKTDNTVILKQKIKTMIGR
jgi:2-succinyl-5-enolpyruvyl-6-hydroxy-3-cyclohexene-1-carboxylate synthase